MQRMRESKKMSLRMAVCETFAFKCFLLKKFMFFLTSSEGDRRKDLRLFDFIIPLRRTSVACSGRILSEGTLTSKLVLEVQTPAPCTYYVSAEFRLTGHVQSSN